MDLFTYLMAKNSQNIGGDLFSYLLGKKASGGSGTYTTFSGTSLNISNTIKAAIKKFMLNPTELTQDGTPSPDNPVDVNVITGDNNINITNTRNLFDFSNITVGKLGTAGTVTVDGDIITFTANNQNVYAVEIDLKNLNLKPNTTYTVSNLYENTGSFAISSGWRYYNGSTYTSLPGGKTYFNFTTGDGTTNKLYFYVGSPTLYTGTLTLYDIQLLEGEILERDIPTYIPYSQKLEQNYPITLSSKNLFNINGDVNTRYNGQTGNYNYVENNKLTATYSTNDGYPYGQRIYVGTGKKVTISGVVSNINSTGSKSALIMCFNDNTTTGVQSIAFDDTEINTRKSFSFTADTDYIIVAFAGRYNGFVSATFTDIQVEYGETATNYMPYIANPIEYCKIGDYADQIFKNTKDSEFYDSTLLENEWYLKKNIINYKIEKNTHWDNHINNNGVRVFAHGGVSNSYINYSGQKCNCFKYTDSLYNYGGENTFQIGFGWVYIGSSKFADSTELNEFLTSHNVVCKIPTNSPEYIHISETDYPILRSQLENLYNNAKSYNGQTNITQTNDGLPFNISVDVKVS